MSSAELSLEISHLVARALNGEAIDTAEEGRHLACRYPDLGLTGELIGKGIARAAAMMSVVRQGWEKKPVPLLPSVDDNPLILPQATLSEADPITQFETHHERVFEALAAELSAALSNQRPEGIDHGSKPVDATELNFAPSQPEEVMSNSHRVAKPVARPETGSRRIRPRGAVAAFRRALARS